MAARALCIVLVASLIASTHASNSTSACGTGGKPFQGNCVCNVGWAKDTEGKCNECATGFFGSKYGLCTNGRAGTACQDSLPFPMGCGGGRCSANGAKAAFPCVSCANQKDPASGCTASATCPANGPMIYTPFPNSPVADVKFNLIVVGCELDKIDKIAIVPVQKLDAGASATTCGDVVDSSFASECTFQMDENNAGPNSSELYTAPNDCRSGVKFEGSFPTFSEGSTARHTRLGVHNVHFSLEYVQTFAPADFMVCFPSTRVTPSGELVEVWRAVAGHNEDVSARDYKFTVEDRFITRRDSPRGAAGMGEGYDEDCCEGLKLGDMCLPLWAFLLLWLLMAACLGVLLFLLHKNHGELEQARNNRKYEQFCADAEMIDLDDKDMEDL